MNKDNILLEIIDGQESCNTDRINITPSCNGEDENVDEILSDIEKMSNLCQIKILCQMIINLCLYPEI